MLGHVLTTGRNLLSPTSSELPTQPEVLGCDECELIYSRTIYYGNGGGHRCPVCGGETRPLGELPYIVKDETEKFFLMNNDGVFTGPYDTESDAQIDLWSWFSKREEHAKAQVPRKEGLRLVACDGVIIQEARAQEADQASGS